MKYTKVIIAYIVGLILLYFWYRTIDFEKFFYHLKQINFVYVIISGLFYALAYFIRSCRWKYLLNNIKIVSLSRMYLLFMTGLLINYIVPVRAGEVLKSYFLKKIENIRMSKSLPTVFLDKLMDLLPVIILIALLPFVKFSGTFVDTKVFYILIALISGILIVALLIIYYSSINKAFFTKLTHKFLFWYKGKLKSRFIEFVENFIESLHTIEKTWKNFGILFIYTLSCIIDEAIYVWCLFKAFGFSAPFFVIFFGYTLINLIYLFFTPPSGI
ncbi:MAG: hypothetical protein DRH57_07365 [Candidatus Cloacimonadota bacterium]|nr:MAG: hypothetical protein DRH57_07365 [Candidatus Cloacimonadota bacterium]